MNWFNKWLRKRNTKKFIRNFVDNISDNVVIKRWEHYGWGNAIYIDGNTIHGHLSGLRYGGRFCTGICDLRDGDIIVMDVSGSDNPIRSGHRYEIGLFANVQICADPPDMFFSSYIRLGFADDWKQETIIKLAKERMTTL